MVGVPELLIILVIVLLIFGAGKLPAIGDALGRSIKNFKRSTSGADELEVSEAKQVGSKAAAELNSGRSAGVAEDADVVPEVES